eukprot:1425142-Rhodomonas_salina.1
MGVEGAVFGLGGGWAREAWKKGVANGWMDARTDARTHRCMHKCIHASMHAKHQAQETTRPAPQLLFL